MRALCTVLAFRRPSVAKLGHTSRDQALDAAIAWVAIEVRGARENTLTVLRVAFGGGALRVARARQREWTGYRECSDGCDHGRLLRGRLLVALLRLLWLLVALLRLLWLLVALLRLLLILCVRRYGSRLFVLLAGPGSHHQARHRHDPFRCVHSDLQRCYARSLRNVAPFVLIDRALCALVVQLDRMHPRGSASPGRPGQHRTSAHAIEWQRSPGSRTKQNAHFRRSHV